MADIELVIKIDEDIYKARQHWIANEKRMVDKVDIAIANGIPFQEICSRKMCMLWAKIYTVKKEHF